MTKFETIGVNYQYEADSIYKANKYFQWSCNCCCHKGVRIQCDRCAIEVAHNLVVASFNEMHKGKEVK